MQLHPTLAAIAVLAAATAAQGQVLLNQPGLPPTVLPSTSTPTPSQPLVAPGLPSLPSPAIGVPAAPVSVPVPSGQEAGHTVSLEQRQAHPNGVVMTLTSITFRPDSTVVSASIINSSGRTTWLNRGGSLALVDDLGHSYPFVPPTGNQDVQIAPQSQVTASFVFVGPVAGGARSVQLSTNGQAGSRGDRLTSAPMFLFRVPVS